MPDGRAGALTRLVPWLLVAVAVLLFAPVARFEFLRFDDPSLVFESPYYNPVTLESMLELWRRPHLGFYIPVTYTVWGLQAALLGLDGGRFHLVGLLVHVANVVLVFSIIRKLLETRNAPAPAVLAGCGALLFAVHPMRVETVAWVSAMKDLLSTFFALLAVRAYFARPARDGGWQYVPRGTIWFVLSLLAKPSMVVLGPLVLLLDVALIRTEWRAALRRIGLWFFIAVPFGLITMAEQPATMLAALPPAWLRPFIAADALAFYVAKTLVPTGLAPVYARTPDWLLESGVWRFTWIVPALLLAGALWAARKKRYEPLGLLAAFVVALVPVIGLVPSLGYQLSVVADHYMYFPFLIVSLAASVALASAPDRWRPAGVVAVVAVSAVLAFGTARYLPRWRDDAAWFPYAIERAPRSALLRMTHGESLYGRGLHDQGLAEFRAAAAILPHSDIYNNIGAALIALRRYEEARLALEQALALDPDDPEIQQNLARLTRMIGR